VSIEKHIHLGRLGNTYYLYLGGESPTIETQFSPPPSRHSEKPDPLGCQKKKIIFPDFGEKAHLPGRVLRACPYDEGGGGRIVFVFNINTI
jgi:hypothetical protein